MSPITTEPSPNPPPAGVARVRLTGNITGRGWGIGHWLLLTGAPTSADLLDLAGNINSEFAGTVMPNLSSQVALQEVSVRYYSGSGEIAVSSFGSAVGGASGWLTSETCCLVSWGIGESYRGGKPRTYLPTPPASAADGPYFFSDAFISAVQADMVTYWEFINAYTASSIDSVSLGVVHFFSGGVALDPPTFSPFISLGVQKRLCSQRRRLGAEVF